MQHPQALVSFKKCMPPPLPYFKVNICPLPLPHFASIFFAYLWSFRWANYIVTLPRYFSLPWSKGEEGAYIFWMKQVPVGVASYWMMKLKKRCFKNKMSVIWSWTYFLLILSLTQLYRYTPEIFLFRLPHLNIPTGTPSDELDKTIQRKWQIDLETNKKGVLKIKCQ
jgi:hypothetical protein